MDKWLIFHYLIMFRWRDGGHKFERIIGFTLLALELLGRQIRPCWTRCRLNGGFGHQIKRRAFQEKLLRINIMRPYRKPTQVVRSRRPRRTSEGSPRNSAKQRPYPRYKVCPRKWAAAKDSWRLFIKNTAPC